MLRILFVSVLLAASLLGLTIGTDIVSGYDLKKAVHTSINPFRTMEIPEMIVLICFILVFIIQQIIQLVRGAIQKVSKH